MKYTRNDLSYTIAIITGLIVMLGILLLCKGCYADEWRISHYCACEKCCGKWADGHFASGKKVYVGGVACNWLKFGTKIEIDGKIYTVEDRGAKSIFGDNNNHIKAIDIYCDSHQEARNKGIYYSKVKIIE